MPATQPALSGLAAPRRRPRAPVELTTELPVARVVVDRGQPHLDREFEYAVPASMAEVARPGVRVRVRFAGQDVDGWLVERGAEASHDGPLTPLRRVVSAEVVLTPAVLALARAVARRYAGTVPDVLRLAVPPRHATVEQEVWPAAAGVEDRPVGGSAPPGAGSAPADVVAPAPWRDHHGGAAFLRRVAAGEAPRAVWQALPGEAGEQWADAIAAAVLAARTAGRGSLVVLPSAGPGARVGRALESVGVPRWTPGAHGGWVLLHADAGPAERYRSFLAVARGAADVVVGTRAAAFAPVADLGLVACWDDSDHLHAEPRAPYPHVREVLALRAAQGAAMLVGGWTRSVATQRWIASGWAQPLVADRAAVRGRTPRVDALTAAELAPEGPSAGARLPSAAWRTIRDGLASGPVLVQVPRAGYLPALACQDCRATARCAACAGPLHLSGATGPAQCRWCGRLAGDWRCPSCSGTRLRSVRVGSQRTAEELGRAFPGVPVRTSSAATGVLERVGAAPVLVVATPGAEPVADGGYAAAALLDAGTLTGRSGLDVGEQALATWLGAAALVRPAVAGGTVALVGDAAPAPAQALVRWDPAGFAERELDERAELGLPPAVHMVAVDGPREAVADLVSALAGRTTVLGPLPLEHPPAALVPDQGVLDPEQDRPVRALLRTDWPEADRLVVALGAAVAARSARRAAPVRVQVEPGDLL